MATQPENVTLALYALGGEREPIHTEDVAVRVVDIAPGVFSWEKYGDMIDKELVRRALTDAKLKTGYVIGSQSQGWMLTPEGLEFARASFHTRAGEGGTQRRRPEDRQWERERARLLTSDAYMRLQTDGPGAVTADEADAFFRLNVYVRGPAREWKIARILNHFERDPELGDAVRLLSARARERTT